MFYFVFVENKVKKIKKKTNASHSKQNSSSNASSVNIVGLPLQSNSSYNFLIKQSPLFDFLKHIGSRGLKVAAATSQIKNSSQQVLF